jgi:hypothetical protein
MMTPQIRAGQESTENSSCAFLPAVEITLRNGGVARVDAADLQSVSLLKWNRAVIGNHSYARVDIGGRSILMHRHLMGLEPGDTRVVDHIDGDGLNNQRANLRVCTTAENVRNRKRHSSNSGYKGVHKVRSGYVAKCGEHDRYIGHFRSKHAAAMAYNKAAIERFGRFASLNVVDVDAYRAELRQEIASSARHIEYLEQLLKEID